MPTNLKLEKSRSIVSSTSTLPTDEKVGLVSVQNNQAVTTSLKVAVYFGKQHKDVLKAINLLESSDLFRRRNFALSCYTRKNGNVSKSYPMYYLTRDGFTLLAMGFTGKVAARFKEAYINAFNEMEEMLRSKERTEFANKLLKTAVNRFNRRMKEAVMHGRERHGKYYGGLGDMTPYLPYYDGITFEENLRNILALVNNSYLDSMFFISELRKNEEALRDLRNEVREAICTLQSKTGY